MGKTKKKHHIWGASYAVLLTAFTAYVLLDAFIIPKSFQRVDGDKTVYSSGNSSSKTSAAGTYTKSSYKDENISITISSVREYNTDIYIADIELSSIEYLKAALAGDTFGRNIKETTSQMAQDHSAIFAINGDYYGFRDDGFVVRNGILYRDTAQRDVSMEDLVIYKDGSFGIVSEASADASSLVSSGALQVFSFGPSLLQNGKLAVGTTAEVGRSKASNPRTGIGIINPLHYVAIVSDGRTSKSTGLSLYQLGSIFQKMGCSTAYNLDGGGSSTMWFNGSVVNNPTDGRSSGERRVSDIVYVGY